jgi:hypothetical protein
VLASVAPVGTCTRPPARVQQVQNIKDLKLHPKGLAARGGKRLTDSEIGQVHPWRSAAVARHDLASLVVQTARAVDETLECHLLRRDLGLCSAETDFCRIERGPRM